MDDRELEQLAKRLGERGASNLDVERTAQQVLARLRAQPAPVVRWWERIDVLRAAAVAVVIVGAGLLAQRLGVAPGPTTRPSELPAATLQTLSQNELQEVLDSLMEDAPASEVLTAGLHDLDDGQLVELLQRLEG